MKKSGTQSINIYRESYLTILCVMSNAMIYFIGIRYDARSFVRNVLGITIIILVNVPLASGSAIITNSFLYGFLIALYHEVYNFIKCNIYS